MAGAALVEQALAGGRILRGGGGLRHHAERKNRTGQKNP
jgi:hypothetical protein